MTELKKWWQTMKMWWVSLLTYRFNFLCTVFGPTLIFFIVKYSLWSAIYKTPGNTVIAGYTFLQMVQYHFWIMIVALVGQGANVLKISEDMRMGRISAYLIYPFQFWKFHAAGFLAWQMVELGIAALSIILFAGFGYLPACNLSDIVLGLLFSMVVGCTWFSIQFLVGVLGFWLDETWMIRVALQFISNFLAGAIIPLELFPKALRGALRYSPFPYLGSVPVHIFMGTDDRSFCTGAAILLVWCAAFALVSSFAWRSGVKLYSGAGI